MKYIITESKAEDVILKYLDRYIEPDYSWGPELHSFYRKDVKQHGSYDFVINDRLAYSYWDGVGNDKLLEVMPWVYEQLDGLFGDMWKPIFIKWFEKNSGLKIRHFDKYTDEQ
jgi:hypothetical protein